MHRALANGCGITEPSDLGDVALEDEEGEVTASPSSFGVEPLCVDAGGAESLSCREEPSPYTGPWGLDSLNDVLRTCNASCHKPVRAWRSSKNRSRCGTTRSMMPGFAPWCPRPPCSRKNTMNSPPRAGRERRDEAPFDEVRELMAQRDELLREWTPKDENG